MLETCFFLVSLLRLPCQDYLPTPSFLKKKKKFINNIRYVVPSEVLISNTLQLPKTYQRSPFLSMKPPAPPNSLSPLKKPFLPLKTLLIQEPPPYEPPCYLGHPPYPRTPCPPKNILPPQEHPSYPGSPFSPIGKNPLPIQEASPFSRTSCLHYASTYPRPPLTKNLAYLRTLSLPMLPSQSVKMRPSS